MSNEKNILAPVNNEDETAVDAADTMVAEDEENESLALYVHEFEKPFTWEGKTYDKLTFDFSKLRGKDVLAIMREIRMAGITVASRTFDVEYQYRYAARCCEPRIGSDVIAALPAKEFERICTRVQRFLLRSAL